VIQASLGLSGQDRAEESPKHPPIRTVNRTARINASLADPEFALKESDGEGCSTAPFIFPFRRPEHPLRRQRQSPGIEAAHRRLSGSQGPLPQERKAQRLLLQAAGNRCQAKARQSTKLPRCPLQAKVKPGRSATVSLIPKTSFNLVLASAQVILVKETLSSKGKVKTRYLKLPVVQ
jgi:hypothetical protein